MGFNREFLPTYYQQIFPCEELFEWLGGEKNFEKREISMTLYDERDPEGVYLRWCSYKDPKEFRN